MSIRKKIGCSSVALLREYLCSRNGVCILNGTIINEADVPNSYCQCNPGWTTYGDFASAYIGHDCITHIVFSQTLYAIYFITAMMAFLYLLHKIRLAWIYSTEKYKIDRRAALLNGERIPFGPRIRTIWNLPIGQVAFPAVVGYFFTCICLLLRLSDIEATTFGYQPTSSTLFFFALITQWIGFTNVFHLQTKMLVKLSGLKITNSNYTQKHLNIFEFGRILTLISCLPLLILPYTPETSDELVFVFTFGQLIGVLIMYGGDLSALVHIVELLQSTVDAINDDKARKEGVVLRIKRRVLFTKILLPPVISFAIVACFWSYLRVRHSYIMTFCYCNGTILAMIAYYSLDVPTVPRPAQESPVKQGGYGKLEQSEKKLVKEPEKVQESDGGSSTSGSSSNDQDSGSITKGQEKLIQLDVRS